MATEDKNPQVTRRKFLIWTGAVAASAGLGPLLATGCGTSAVPAAAPTAAPAGAPAKAVAPTQPPAKAGVIELKLAHHEAAVGAEGKAFQAYADAVAEKSGGRLHITVYPSETLGKVADAYNNVVNGIADIAWTPVSYMSGKAPLTEAFNLPMLGFTSAQHAARAHAMWVKTNPIVQKEWSEVHLLVPFAVGGTALFTAKKPLRKLEDLAGMKMQASASFGPTNFMKAVGASPNPIGTPDIYDALTKGVIEGYLTSPAAVMSQRLYEITKYMVVGMPIYNGHAALSMNKKKWESLPPDLQQILEDPGLKPSAGEYLAGAFDTHDAEVKAAIEKAGGEGITWPPEEVARLQAVTKTVWNSWAETVKDKGFDGVKEVQNLVDIVAKTK